MEKFGIITKSLLTCAGIDLSTMAQCTSSETNRYKIIGACVLLPAFLGLFSGGCAMYLISKNYLFSLLFAPCWSIIIFILDRAVIASTKPGELSWGIIGRIFLSIVIAFTISEPVILSLFSDAIESERITIVREKQDAAVFDYKKQIAALDELSKNELTIVRNLERAYIQEVDGTGGSKTPYRGTIAKIKEKAYQNALKTFNKNDSLRNQKIATIELYMKNKEQEVSEKDADGFLGNMMILGKMSKENNIVFWSIWLMRLLFFCIELIPILIKIGSSHKFELYYEILDNNDRNCSAIQAIINKIKLENMILEEKVKSTEKRLELLSQEIELIIQSEVKDYNYFIDKISYLIERQPKVESSIIEMAINDIIKNELLTQASAICKNYMITLQKLIAKPKQYYTETNINL